MLLIPINFTISNLRWINTTYNFFYRPLIIFSPILSISFLKCLQSLQISMLPITLPLSRWLCLWLHKEKSLGWNYFKVLPPHPPTYSIQQVLLALIPLSESGKYDFCFKASPLWLHIFPLSSLLAYLIYPISYTRNLFLTFDSSFSLSFHIRQSLRLVKTIP